MPESIFTSQTPSTADSNNPAGQRALGVVFSAAVAGSVIGVRWYAPTTPVANPVGSLWSPTAANPNASTGTQLNSATIAVSTPETWNSFIFAAATPIAAGTPYTVVIWTPDHYTFSGPDPFPITNGNLTAYSSAAAGNGRFENGVAAGAYPGNGSSGFNFFVDVLFVANTDLTLTGQPGAAGPDGVPATLTLGSVLTGQPGQPGPDGAPATLVRGGVLTGQPGQPGPDGAPAALTRGAVLTGQPGQPGPDGIPAAFTRGGVLTGQPGQPAPAGTPAAFTLGAAAVVLSGQPAGPAGAGTPTTFTGTTPAKIPELGGTVTVAGLGGTVTVAGLGGTVELI